MTLIIVPTGVRANLRRWRLVLDGNGSGIYRPLTSNHKGGASIEVTIRVQYFTRRFDYDLFGASSRNCTKCCQTWTRLVYKVVSCADYYVFVESWLMLNRKMISPPKKRNREKCSGMGNPSIAHGIYMQLDHAIGKECTHSRSARFSRK